MKNTEIKGKFKNEYLNKEKITKFGEKIKIIEYINAHDIIVQFDDKTTKHASLQSFNQGNIKKDINRIGLITRTKDKDIVKIIEYNSYSDIIVEFQDNYRAKVHTTFNSFKNGTIRNPYKINKYGGILGDKYPVKTTSKEYNAWYNILVRCFDEKVKEKHPTYKECTVCKEWLYFPNFYEWLCSQENFKKWLNGDKWAVDKDIIIKGNKIYSPYTCCLVPKNINNLFLKHDNKRGNFPIGVTQRKSDLMYEAQCKNPFNNKYITIGLYNTSEEAFHAYKKVKEKFIKQMAQQEYENGNISKKCYDAMINYQVEITD